MINLFFFLHDHSGARTYANELLRWLSLSKGVNVHKVYFESASSKEYSVVKEENLTTICIPVLKHKRQTLEKFSRRCLDLMTPIIQGKNNIIFHLNKSAQINIGLEARNRFNAKIIYTLHYLPGYFSSSLTKIANLENFITTDNPLDKEITSEADHIICVTQYASKIIEKYYSVQAPKMTVIYNGFSSLSNSIQDKFLKEVHKKKFGFHADEQIILFVGRLQKEKGVEKLLKAFEMLNNEFGNLHLVLVGEGELRELINENWGNFGQVCLTGELSSEQVSQLYQIADLGVIPSEFEQCSYVALEMMYHSLPVVCSDAHGLKELFSDEESALIVPIQGSTNLRLSLETKGQGLFKAINRLLHDKALATKLAKTAYLRWQEQFTSDCMGQATLKVYNEIMLKDDRNIIKKNIIIN